ncbi:hypothetical protein FA95DRAFT_1568320 [Auriscalpium vulgare]|uniref:Uncharacterized protein n=1 Tax=Auriscalpium vulgare TaxID=40419 RepID=A0ACB8SDS4_9AGAM|nr:hypothetical protein FA95DRAFT_1568320 [Auriscalpium vulgare]
MPSLRRTISSPAVRSSPYPSSQPSQTARPGGQRRSSGSDVASRRVLADIDWWLVTDGQHHPHSQEESDAAEGTVPAPADPVLLAADLASTTGSGTEQLERPSTPVPSDLSLFPIVDASPQAHRYGQPSAFAIGPRTPTRRHASDASSESVESSPHTPRTPRECLSFADMGFADPGSDVPPIRVRPVSLAAIKSFSFAAFTTPDKDRSGDHSVFDNLADAAYIHGDDIFA